jgi:hypothetical protein
MQPDLVIVGDSHTAALHEGAIAGGLRSELLYISGNHWHENKMLRHQTQGLAAPYRPGLNRIIAAFAKKVGGTVFPADIPVLASIGYHLGRLSPMLKRTGHSPDAEEVAEDESLLFLSEAFLTSYIFSHRDSLFRVLRFARQKSEMIVVAPPIIRADPVSLHLAARITSILRANGIQVFDPREEADWSGKSLPEHFRAPDMVHGNADYGAEVLARIFDRGLLRKVA